MGHRHEHVYMQRCFLELFRGSSSFLFFDVYIDVRTGPYLTPEELDAIGVDHVLNNTIWWPPRHLKPIRNNYDEFVRSLVFPSHPSEPLPDALQHEHT